MYRSHGHFSNQGLLDQIVLFTFTAVPHGLIYRRKRSPHNMMSPTLQKRFKLPQPSYGLKQSHRF